MPLSVLYIPIWLYSNDIRFYAITGGRGCFTFQSGYIQMGTMAGAAIGGSIFTFQSGYIQIKHSRD